MGIETLNSAARAAGFAMAPPDELLNETTPVVEPDGKPGRPNEAVLLDPIQSADQRKATHSVSDWLKGMFGAFARRAPA